MTTLKQLTDQVVEDKEVQKALTSYCEGGRDILCVRIFAGKSVLSSSPEIAEWLEKKPELIAALMELFEDTVDTVDTVDTLYTVYTDYTVYAVYTVDIDTVYTVTVTVTRW